MKKISLALLVIFCLTLVSCGSKNSATDVTPEPGISSKALMETSSGSSETSPVPEESSSSDPSSTVAEESIAGQEPPQEPAGNLEEDSAPAPIEQTATLYIGTKARGFTEYSMAYEGELTPEALIQGISDLTGWDLALAEPVISGKGGMSVCLSSGSTLFTGPPDPQKEEFFVYGLEDLAETLLDSIQKTLQNGFTGEGGDPDALDIWYYMEGEQPLELPTLGLTWPLDQPYQWAGAESE